jgi:NADPH:quinone reductase
MKAIQFDQYGEPAKVLAVQERAIPEPGKGEVRFRILASPINPSDLLFVQDIMQVFNPISHHPPDLKGLAS